MSELGVSMRVQWFVRTLMIGGLLLHGSVQAKFRNPPSVDVPLGKKEPVCNTDLPEWRKAQTIEGVQIQESKRCTPDNPALVASVVKGTNNISMSTLMDTRLSPDTVIKTQDLDGDGDPDKIEIHLEVVELNGFSPDFDGIVPRFPIAPGVTPGMWVFTPKNRGMSTMSFASIEANPLLRAPSPTIRIEEDDVLWIVLENTHYFPHTIHLHGVDHPFVDSSGEGNDGVPQTSEKFVLPGETRTYEIRPRLPGTFIYHCHVQTHTHVGMGLIGMLVVEENRPNNLVQTFNVGAGQVRHPSKGVLSRYDHEYDLVYHQLDKELGEIVQKYNDPRLVAWDMNQRYDLTDASEDYHTLNGRSFPYTIRESMIVARPDQKIKLRMMNGGSELMAIHTHGHKATITHYDGVKADANAMITRDVYDIAPAQRLDLEINTSDDGLHSYGEGLWIFHDHAERGITTDGMNPGGNVSILAYDSWLTDEGLPKGQGRDVSNMFTEAFYNRSQPVFAGLDAVNTWGAVQAPPVIPKVSPPAPAGQNQASASSSWFSQLLVGLLLGIAVYLAYVFREKIVAALKGLASSRLNKEVAND